MDGFDFRTDMLEHQVASEGRPLSVSRPILADKRQNVSSARVTNCSQWSFPQPLRAIIIWDIIIQIQVRCSEIVLLPEQSWLSMGGALLRVVHRSRQERHLSRSHHWLLISERSKSSCTKCAGAEMEGQKKRKVPFISENAASDSPFCPIRCEVGLSLQHLNYMQECMRPLINSAYANATGNLIGGEWGLALWYNNLYQQRTRECSYEKVKD